MMKKRILFTNRYTLLDAQVAELAKIHDVVVLERGIYKYVPIVGVKTVPIEFRTLFIDYFLHSFLKKEVSIPLWIVSLNKILKSEAPDIIVVFDFYHFILWQTLTYVKDNPGTKIILASETKRYPANYIARRMFNGFFAILKRNLNHIGKIFVFTTKGQEWFSTELPNVVTEVLAIPVDTTLFKPVVRDGWFPNDKLRIVMNARYVPYKRHADLLHAVFNLSSRNIPLQLTLIGRSGGYKHEIEKLVRSLGIGSLVNFIEPVPQDALPSLYSHHDVLVLPSENEAIGMVVPEAMACGLPTITSDTVGANLYVKEGGTGLIFKTGDINCLEKSLVQMCNKQLLKEMGRRSEEMISNKFSTTVLGDDFINFFSKPTTGTFKSQS